jgi:hypothetical protein
MGLMLLIADVVLEKRKTHPEDWGKGPRIM